VKYMEFLDTWRGTQAENKFSRMIIMGLISSNIITGLVLLQSDKTIVMVPPHFKDEIKMTYSKANQEFKTSWGTYFSILMGNISPGNSKFIKKTIEPFLGASIYREAMSAISDQLADIDLERVTLAFNPRMVSYEKETDKVFITGKLIEKGPSGKPKIHVRTYEFIISVDNYKPKMMHVDVYRGEARTINSVPGKQAAEKAKKG